MNDEPSKPEPSDTPPPPSSPPPANPELPRPAGGGGSALGWIALLVATAALVMGSLMWQKLGLAQQELARRSSDSASEASDARSAAAAAEALAQELQARLSVAEVRLSEVSLQRSQLEELMLSVSRSRDDNLVDDLESTLRLAQQQAQLTGSAQPLVSALQAADQRIARAAQPRLNPVQRAIARDIERIQAATLTDVPALVQRLDELARLSDDMPLASDVAKTRAAARPARNVRPPGAMPPLPQGDSDGEPELSLWGRVLQGWDRLRERVWADITEETRDLVRVSRIDDPEAMLVSPQQSFWLRQNLKLQLLNARLALLARQMPAARSDVAAAQRAVQRYFDPEAGATQTMLMALIKAQADMKGGELPRPDETLAALVAAAGGR